MHKLSKILTEIKFSNPRKIAISGFSGTGKTTLVKELASILPNSYIIPSYSSEFIRDNRIKGCEKQKALLEFAIKYQKEHLLKDNSLAIFDRAVLDVIGYSKFFCPDIYKKQLSDIKYYKLYDKIFVITRDKDFLRKSWLDNQVKYSRLFSSFDEFYKAYQEFTTFYKNLSKDLTNRIIVI